MHVLLQGIVPKHLGLFLSKMISLKLVNLSKLNGAIQAFSYQYFESPSKPSSIPLSAVREENLTGKQSGKYDIIQYVVARNARPSHSSNRENVS